MNKNISEIALVLESNYKLFREEDKQKICLMSVLISYNGYSERVLKGLGDKVEIEKILEEIEDKKGISKVFFTNSRLFSEIKSETLCSIFSKIDELHISKEEWKVAVDELINLNNKTTVYSTVTPNYISKLGVAIIDPNGGSFADLTCGSGSIAGEIKDYADKKGNEVKIFCQDINKDFAEICKIRLSMMGIDDAKIEVGNSLTEPKFIENGKLKKFTNIMMNPPMGMDWRADKLEIEDDKNNLFRYGKPPVSSAEWLFVSEGIELLEEKGVFILPSGALFRGGSEEEIRKNIIRQDIIEAVISLSGVLKNTKVPVNILVINKNKDKDLKNKVLFINATSMYKSERFQKILTDVEIEEIVDIYRNKKEVDQISEILNLEELENGNILASSIVKVREIDDEILGKIKFSKSKIENVKNKSTKLEEIADFYRGINVTGKNIEENKEGQYKIINLSDVNDGKINIDSLKRYSIKNNARTEAYKVKEGDILISNKGTSIKICIIPKHNEEILISQNFIGVRLKSNNNPEYVKYFLESPLGQYLISDIQAGTAVVTINTKDLKTLPIILNDLEEQNKTVEKYDEEQDMLKNKIKEIEEKSKESTLELYKSMGIMDAFDIL